MTVVFTRWDNLRLLVLRADEAVLERYDAYDNKQGRRWLRHCGRVVHQDCAALVVLRNGSVDVSALARRSNS